jgi:hypothetical protein
MKSAATALSHASLLGDRLGTDAHDLGIPVGVPLGSVYDYAAACVRERPWTQVMLALVKAQMKETK